MSYLVFKRLRLPALVCVIAAMMSARLAAQDLKFNGFLSIAGYHGSSNEIGFKSTLTGKQSSKLDEWVFDDLSLLGAQLNYEFNDNLELVTQALIKNEVVDTELDRVKIATLNYRPNSAWLFRAGRFYPRIYLVSESRYNGYAHNEVLPVHDFYAQLPLPYVDGVDATYTSRNEFGLINANLYYGQTKITLDLDSIGKFSNTLDNLVGFNLEYEVSDWLFRASYSQLEQFGKWDFMQDAEDFIRLLANPQSIPAENPLTPWFEGLNVLNQANSKDGTYKYYSFAIEYYDFSTRIRSELAHLASGNYTLPDTNTGYINVAHRLGEFTPFATLSFIDSTAGLKFNSLPSDELIQAVDKTYELDTLLILDIIGEFINPTYKQHSLALGMRWDFADRQALKAQFERKWVSRNGAGLWGTDSYTDTAAEQVNVFLVSYDRMF